MAKRNARTASSTRTGTVPRAARTQTAAPAHRPAASRGEKTDSAETGEGRPVRRKTAAARRAPKLPRVVSGAVHAALDKKAEDVVVLDLKKAGGFTDYFVICTGANPRQITAIADAVRETLKRDFDERATLAEGIDRSEWILLDYFDFVVHIFSRDCRAFYGLERLWGNAERIEFTPEGSTR
jgi:ribosome-associated protein